MFLLEKPHVIPKIFIKNKNILELIDVLKNNKEKLNIEYKFDISSHAFTYRDTKFGYQNISFVFTILENEVLFHVQKGEVFSDSKRYINLIKKVLHSLEEENEIKFAVKFQKCSKKIEGETAILLENFILFTHNKEKICQYDWNRYYCFIRWAYRYKSKNTRVDLEEILINAKFPQDTIKFLLEIFVHGIKILKS